MTLVNYLYYDNSIIIKDLKYLIENIDLILNILSNSITIIMFYLWVVLEISKGKYNTIIILIDHRINTFSNTEKINKIKSIPS
jgi:hypothetical protein